LETRLAEEEETWEAEEEETWEAEEEETWEAEWVMSCCDGYRANYHHA
jgi:hypothetical protein